MFAQFRKQQLQSYSFHSRDRPWPLMSRCGEIRKKNTSKLWILVMIINVGGGLPGGGDGILQGFEILNIWKVRHKKRCPSAKWPLEQAWVPCQPFSTLTRMLRNALRNILPIFPLVLQNRSTTTGNSGEKLTTEFPADFSTKRNLWKTMHRQVKCWKLSRLTDWHDPKWREYTSRTQWGVGSCGKPFLPKNPGPGQMAETPRANTGDSACRSWHYPCSIVFIRQEDHQAFHNWHFLGQIVPDNDCG